MNLLKATTFSMAIAALGVLVGCNGDDTASMKLTEQQQRTDIAVDSEPVLGQEAPQAQRMPTEIGSRPDAAGSGMSTQLADAEEWDWSYGED